MQDSVERLNSVKQTIAAAEKEAGRNKGSVTLVAVSKTFGAPEIRPVLEAGQRIFGENRVQEAQGKWPTLKADYPGIELHLIGPLQSNKAEDAVALFDVIQTVDREKIAAALASEMKKQGRKPRFHVQVNTGLEEQKAGIDPARDRGFCPALSRRARPRHRRPDVHPASWRKPRPALCTVEKAGGRMWFGETVVRHVRRL